MISIDRLTRFKYTEDKYLRVFKEIILSNLIEPKYKKKDLDSMDYNIIKELAQNIINLSISDFSNAENNLIINKKIAKYENDLYNLSDNTNILLDNKINYNAFVSLIEDSAPQNLKWLKSLKFGKTARETLSLKFPIRKVVIVEGVTEEILLPVFAAKYGYNFDKHGIQVVSAGGKNQVVKLFYTFAEQLKIPIFVLLDNDALSNYNQIKLRLRNFDKIHLLIGGEFEDILPKELIVKSLNDYFKNLNHIEESEFENDKMVTNLEEIFKKKGFHEFKKSEFAQIIKEHIDNISDISDEIKTIIDEISATRSFLLQ